MREPVDRRPPAPLTFLVEDASGGGGIARTVANLANALVERRPVTLVALRRRREQLRFPLDPRIAVTTVADLHGEQRRRPLHRDAGLRATLAGVRHGVVVSTRPALHRAALSHLDPRVPLIAWDHLNFPARRADPDHWEAMATTADHADALVVLTEADAADYRSALPHRAAELVVIRNSVGWHRATRPAPLSAPVLVAAGRLVEEKGFARMFRAFAPVAADHPAWQLHVYGAGPDRRALEAYVDRLGLSDRILLRGYTADLRGELSGAAALLMTSHVEGFPMVLVEAMSLGLPLVAFDCPRGPAEIIDPGRTGLLVPDGDEHAFTRAIRSVVTDADARQRMGAAGWQRAGAYELRRVAAQWEALLDDVARRHRPREGPVERPDEPVAGPGEQPGEQPAEEPGRPLSGRPLHPEPSRH